LIGDPDRGDVLRRGAPGIQCLGDHEAHVLADLGGIVLDPSRAREVLLVLALAGADEEARTVEQDGPRARRALVDREDVARPGHRTRTSGVSSPMER
jgi:hypothetical protein